MKPVPGVNIAAGGLQTSNGELLATHPTVGSANPATNDTFAAEAHTAGYRQSPELVLPAPTELSDAELAVAHHAPVNFPTPPAGAIDVATLTAGGGIDPHATGKGGHTGYGPPKAGGVKR